MHELQLRGARAHNLKDVDLDLPLGRWIAVTGPSGSGKTSLVFETLVREGQHRYLGGLSARARQFFGKLGAAPLDEVRGLPVALAVGAERLTANARSTVGTQSGVLDLLRLLYAREAAEPGGEALSRSHFSFNRPEGACDACQGLGVADRVDAELLVADPTQTLRGGALVPTQPNGYTVYSQVTVDVMDTICRAHGFDVDTPWRDLTDAQREVIFFGSQELKVPFGKHTLESRMRWEGITARPREEGYYRGLIPVIEETLKRSRNPGVLRFVRSSACETCGGSRLARPGREAQLADITLPQLCAQPVERLPDALRSLPQSPVLDALLPALSARLARMQRLSLGHLTLARESTTLSGGEAQRLRLVAQLGAELGGLLVALDEPTLGLHPGAQAGLAAELEALRARGNTLLVVEHDPDLVRRAEHVVELGPGAGVEGGDVVRAGPTPPAPLGEAPPPRTDPRPARGQMTLRGARLHNLRDAGLDVHLGTLNVVLGPAGAGKSSLVFGTLLPALMREPGGPFEELTGAPEGKVRAVDARPIGRTPRSTPATWSGWFDLVRKRFAQTDAARERSFAAGHFSYNNKQGRCSTCEGLGTTRVGLHLLEDLEQTCPACGGRRYAPEVLEVTLDGRTIADVLRLSIADAHAAFAQDAALSPLLAAMEQLGLGYLALGQGSNQLSRGEAQRIKLATLIGAPPREPAILLLDEPDRGLHPVDIERLLGAFDALVAAGHTLVAISHHRHLWAAADHRTLVEDGTARPIDAPPAVDTLPTRAAGTPAARPEAIELRGVRTHNLGGIDVRLPHRALTVIAGVSGSGKSSLAFDTLHAEAWSRYAESLPFQVRRQLQRLPRPALDGATGLTPTIALRQRAGRASGRSTVATQSGLGPLLRLLWSRAGTLDGAPCELSAAHFHEGRALGACPACEGRGAQDRCDPVRLVTDPSRSLANGALGGTKPGAFFTEPGGQHLATLRAVAPDVDWSAPWEELPDAARQLALYGADERVVEVSWSYSRGGRSGTHTFEGTWDGFCALVEREALRRARAKSAAAWREPLTQVPCSDCGGARLGPGPARVEVGGWTLPRLGALSLAECAARLDALVDAAGPIAARLAPELSARLDELLALGLGHLALERRATTLSDGELQRLRLAGVLRSSLSGATVVLDEPSAGLHARDSARLVAALRRLVQAGNTVVAVSHRPALLRAADHLLELGPGAGPEGGRVVAAGTPEAVLAQDGPTARALRTPAAPAGEVAEGRLSIRGANAHNLQEIDVELPTRGLVALSGVSGSGKSTLLFDVLGASARAGAPRGCAALEGLPAFDAVHDSRALSSGETPLGVLGLMRALQDLYRAAGGPDGPERRAFSFASPAGRCEACKGSGRETVALDFLADLELPCPACAGRRYRPEVLDVRWEGLDIAAFLESPSAALQAQLPQGPLARAAQALERVGLGHLALGRRCSSLSGGEAQRLTLAAGLLQAKGTSLFLFDEPARGLHEVDVAGLVEVFRELGARGDLIVTAEHRLSLLAAADWVIDLGPEGGPEGGRVVAAGPPASLREGATAEALRGRLSAAGA